MVGLARATEGLSGLLSFCQRIMSKSLDMPEGKDRVGFGKFI